MSRSYQTVRCALGSPPFSRHEVYLIELAPRNVACFLGKFVTWPEMKAVCGITFGQGSTDALLEAFGRQEAPGRSCCG